MIANFISSNMVNALCWTLIHSLWLGAIFAVLTAVFVLSSRKTKASTRYNALVSFLVLFILSVAAAYCIVVQEQTRKAITVDAISDAALAQNKYGEKPIAVALNMPEAGRLNVVTDWCNAHAGWIVMGWLLIMGLKCLRMGFELWYIRRLCSQQTSLPAQNWHERVQQLARALHIKGPILFLESARVKIPATVGFIKPIILMPLGLLAQLPPAHIEAILLHELAHIRRSDYLVNLLQSVAEILFFFNPALLWLSALIRTERENCCDDVALNAVENKTHYIQALVAFQEYQLLGTAYAIAFAESKTPLLDRIKRILHNHNTKTLSIMEKISLFVSVLLIASIAFLPLAKTRAQEKMASPSFSQVSISGKGTENDPQVLFLRETDGKNYIISRVNKQITDMYVNGKKIEPAQYADYSTLIKKIDEQIEADIAQSKLDAEQAARDAEQAQLDAEQALRDSEQAKMDAEQAVRDAEQAGMDRVQALRDSEQAKRDAEQAVRDAEQAKRDAEQAQLDREQAVRDAEQAERDSKEDRAMQKKLENLEKEMVADQIVSSRKKIISFALTDTEFIVNGKKQPSTLHEKYKGNYLSKAGYGIYFGDEKWEGRGYFYTKQRSER